MSEPAPRIAACPRCRVRLLDPVRLGSVEVDACNRCGGLWFEQGELARAVKDAVGSVPSGTAFGGRRPESGMRCPGCDEPLSTYEFPEVDGASFDVELCAVCGGIWLDRGELARVQRSHAREVLERKPGWRGYLFQLLLQLPVEFNLPPLRFPLVTLLLVIANVAAMALLILLSSQIEAIVNLFALYPNRVGSSQWLLALPAHTFLHGGLVHLALNMYFLWKLGDNVEDALGRGGYLAFYLVAGIAGGIGQTLLFWGDSVPAVGASGACSGLMAAYAVFFRKARLTWMFIVFQVKLRAPYWVLIWLLLNVLGYLAGQPGIAWGGHLGGFAAGLLLALALDRRVATRNPRVQLVRNT